MRFNCSNRLESALSPHPEAPMPLSRRRMIALSAGAAAATQLGISRPASASPAAEAGQPIDRQLRVPADRAFAYLDFVMDAYAQGDELRLLQSYNNESGLMTTAF